VTALLGRTGELAELTRWASAAVEGRAVVGVVRGDPGLGKSTLLAELRRQLASTSWVVLATAGKDADRELPFASLITLLRPVDSQLEVLAGDGAPALRAALTLGHRPADAVAVQLALFRLLATLAEQSPVAVLVDDLPAIDAATLRTLEFALGRLDADPVLAVLAADDLGSRAIETLAERSLVLGPLGDAPIVAMLAALADTDPSVLAEIAARAAGNPLVATELHAALSTEQRRGHQPIPAVVRPRAALRRSFQQRLDALDEPARRALVVAAADDSGDIAAIVAALGILGEPAVGLDAAEAAGVVAIAGDRLEFTHPLLRAVAYHQVAASSRRAAHGALAAAFTRPEHAVRRAWQLAEAAAGFDEAAAGGLEMVAVDAARRGAPIAAARALERAAVLTGDVDRSATFRTAAARHRLDGGDDTRALAIADAVAPADTLPPEAAATLVDVFEATRGPAPDLVDRWSAAATDPEHAVALRALLADQLLARGERGAAAAVAAEVLVSASDGTAALLARAVRARVESPRAGPLPIAAAAGSLARRARRRAREANGDTTGADHPGADIDDVIAAARTDLEHGRHAIAVGRLQQVQAFGVPGRRRRDLTAVLLIAAELDGSPGAALQPSDLGTVRAAAQRADRHRDGELLAAALGVLARSEEGAEAAAARARVATLDPAASRTTGLRAGGAPVRDQLSVAEYRVARAVSSGRTNRQAAEELFVSRKTVDFHLQQIFRKLGINSRTELAVLVSREVVAGEAL